MLQLSAVLKFYKSLRETIHLHTVNTKGSQCMLRHSKYIHYSSIQVEKATVSCTFEFSRVFKNIFAEILG
jgi:hypothetical protein